MINRNFGTVAVLLALVGLTFGLVGCGNDTTSDTTSGDVFVADHNNPEDLAKLAKLLDIPMEELGEIETHRGVSSEIATLYWPKKDITKDGLMSGFRVDVADYEDNGTLEFRKGRKVLYSAPFVPDDTTTVGAIPQSVLDEIKSGSKVKWGVFFTGKDKRKSVTAEFKVVSSKKLTKRLKKLEGSKYFIRQDATTREMMKTEVFKNTKLYSEALVQYLGILNYWPDVTTPYRGIVQTCRRLDLEDTALCQIASEYVRGGGNLGRGMMRNTNSPARDLAGGGGNTLGNVQAPLTARIPESTAPPLQQRTSEGPRPFGTSHGVTPEAQDLTQPTDDSSSSTDETATDSPTHGSQEERAEWARVHDQLASRARDAEQLATELADNVGAAESAAENLTNAQETATNAESANTAAQSARDQAADDYANTPTPENQHALELAEARLEQTGEALAEAQRSLEYAEGRSREANEALGMPLDEARGRAENAREWADEARQAADAYSTQFEVQFADSEHQQEEMREHARRADIQNTIVGARNNLVAAEQQGQEASASVHSATLALESATAAIQAFELANPGDPIPAELVENMSLAEEGALAAEQALAAAEAHVESARAHLEEVGGDANAVDPNGNPEDDPNAGDR